MYCPSCNQPNPTFNKHCSNCGLALDGSGKYKTGYGPNVTPQQLLNSNTKTYIAIDINGQETSLLDLYGLKYLASVGSINKSSLIRESGQDRWESFESFIQKFPPSDPPLQLPEANLIQSVTTKSPNLKNQNEITLAPSFSSNITPSIYDNEILNSKDNGISKKMIIAFGLIIFVTCFGVALVNKEMRISRKKRAVELVAEARTINRSLIWNGDTVWIGSEGDNHYHWNPQECPVAQPPFIEYKPSSIDSQIYFPMVCMYCTCSTKNKPRLKEILDELNNLKESGINNIDVRSTIGSAKIALNPGH